VDGGSHVTLVGALTRAVWTLGTVTVGFVLGSIPFGVVIARRRGVDLKQQGSGNIGATNVTRVLGPVSGALVLVLDAGKGALPVVLASRVGGAWLMAATGFAAILGHCFSPWLGGRGGKGVATAFGTFLVVAPSDAAIGVVVFALVLAVTRVPALGSLAGAATIAGLLVHRHDVAPAVLACATLALLIYTHRTNLARLR